MKGTVLFEITKEKTLVVATGLDGDVAKFDITKTSIENKLVELLQELKYFPPIKTK